MAEAWWRRHRRATATATGGGDGVTIGASAPMLTELATPLAGDRAALLQ